jgi:peptidyl-prolyl cis-trans isomerase SurA
VRIRSDSLQAVSASLAWLVLLPPALMRSCSRQAAPGRDVMAEVDGRPIYREHVERFYRGRMAQATGAASPEQVLSMKLNILNELINNQILLAHASHAQVAVSEAEVEKKLAQLQSPYSPGEFQKRLGDQGLRLDELREEVRENLIIEKLINKEIISRLSLTDTEIANYYEQNKSNFNVPERQYRLAQIQVTPEASPEVRNLKKDDAKTMAEAQRKIQALYARVRHGEDFGLVAQQYSEDPKTAAGGGDMGFVPASAIDSHPVLKRAISSLKVGQISGVVRTEDGFHIFKMLDREDPGQHPITDPQVQSSIRQTLMNEKEELLKAAYIEDLRNRAHVMNYMAQEIVRNEGGGQRP